MKQGNKINYTTGLFPGSVISLFIILQLIAFGLKAQGEKKADIRLNFELKDSMNICKAMVTSEGKPVKEVDIHFYVKRLFSLLPIGKAVKTDDNGESNTIFPLDLPGDKNGNILVIAKIEEDENYGNAEAQAEIKWGTLSNPENDHWANRSLSASREKAPTYLIVASNLIIMVIWGTIFFVFLQVFRIRKESSLIKKNK
ncbi:MAG: hypothetical protein NT126_10955 [Bacteroidetes bacterium]|nr:hypothetical protein [Bacteroidota bacterium]